MTVGRRSCWFGERLAWAGCVVAVAGLGTACQKSDEHPPFLPACDSECAPLPGVAVSVGGAGAPATPTDVDGGVGTLTGQVVLLTDDSFVHTTLFTDSATVTADGASGKPVSDLWNGADPFVLADVAQAGTNWVSVSPALAAGDALVTYQAVQTAQVNNVNLAVITATTLEGVFSKISALRNPQFGQVVLFFRSAGTGKALSGLHVSMASAELAAYRSGTGWVRDDGLATTDDSGLVVFGNVPSASSGTLPVVVTSGSTKVGQFAVKVVERAATLSAVNVPL